MTRSLLLLVLSLAACAPGHVKILDPDTDTDVSAEDLLDQDRDADGYTPNEGDCDDVLAALNPSSTDAVGDGIDQNCDGVDGVDSDQDGYASRASGGDDCADGQPQVNPGAEEIWYDGLDRNCDGGSDFDQDGDGHDALALDSGDDCDDLRAEVHPGAEEVWYNDLDDDCGGDNDNDQDGDGYWAATRGGPDCDDENAQVFPGQTLWFAVDRGDGSFDYNCSGRDEGRWTHTWDDGSDFCVVPGWYRSTPACGESGQTVQYCGSGTGTFGTRTQLCR